jgi:hypothetical protein
MVFIFVKHASINVCISWNYCSIWSLHTYHVLNNQQISLGLLLCPLKFQWDMFAVSGIVAEKLSLRRKQHVSGPDIWTHSAHDVVKANNAIQIQAYSSLQSINVIFFAPTQNLTANTSEDRVRNLICVFEYQNKNKPLSPSPRIADMKRYFLCVCVCVCVCV